MTNLEYYKDKIKEYCKHDTLMPSVMTVMFELGVDYNKYDEEHDSDILVLNWLVDNYNEGDKNAKNN